MIPARPKKSVSDSLPLEYNLFDLPTAQHKAGLAGLLIFMLGMDPPIEPTTMTATEATIALTHDQMQSVFDELYDAEKIEIASAKKFRKKTAGGGTADVEPKRVEEFVVNRDGKPKKEKRFVYDGVQPKGAFLARRLTEGTRSPWLKLWRDLLWNTFRAIPATRGVYEERAEGAASSEASRIWDTIIRGAKNPADAIASSLFVGAQEVNGEQVPFRGRVQQNLLLHFWQMASLFFVPEVFDAQGKRENRGFVVAIPEVADLDLFTKDFIETLQRLDPAVSGFWPRDARIVIPAEGGLEFLHAFAYDKIRREQIARRIVAVEVFHLEKQGNSVRILSADRILADPRILSEYEVMRKTFRNPHFRSLRLRNLLDGSPWHSGALSMLHRLPYEHFVYTQGTPRVPFFGADARKQFKAIEEQTEPDGEAMTDTERDDKLASRIYRMVRSYVHDKTERRPGRTYESFKNDKEEQDIGGKKVWRIRYPKEYREANEKVCTDAFLAVRGRRDTAFVEYFTGTICSVPQVLPEDEYLAITDALLRDPERVKTLTLFALSAHSALGGLARNEASDEEGARV